MNFPHFQVVQKGKAGTKGQKQILQENDETLNFYLIMIFGGLVAYGAFYLTLFQNFFLVDQVCKFSTFTLVIVFIFLIL